MSFKKNTKYEPGEKCPGRVGVDHCVRCEGSKFSNPRRRARVID